MKVTLSNIPSRYVLYNRDGEYLRIGNPDNWLQLATIFGASFSSHLQNRSHDGWARDIVIKYLDAKVGEIFDVPDDSFSGFKQPDS